MLISFLLSCLVLDISLFFFSCLSLLLTRSQIGLWIDAIKQIGWIVRRGFFAAFFIHHSIDTSFVHSVSLFFRYYFFFQIDSKSLHAQKFKFKWKCSSINFEAIATGKVLGVYYFIIWKEKKKRKTSDSLPSLKFTRCRISKCPLSRCQLTHIDKRSNTNTIQRWRQRRRRKRNV